MDMILAKHNDYPLILVEEIKLTSSHVKYPIVLQGAFAIGVLTSKRGVGCRVGVVQFRKDTTTHPAPSRTGRPMQDCFFGTRISDTWSCMWL